MEYQKKVFWRFIWEDQIKPTNWINSSRFYEYVMMFVILYAVIFTSMTLRQKAILFMGFLIGILIMRFYALYKSGAHRYWNRQKNGIPSRSQIRKMKQERANKNANLLPKK